MRWWILFLLFFATTINYLDRIVLSVLIPTIRDQMHIDTQMYGYITAAFQTAYTVGYPLMGKFIDLVGTKVGFALAATVWSVAAALHTTALTPFQLGTWRALLGLSESAVFPSSIKAVTEWFESKDRAFATGIFNSGTNISSVVGPPLFIWLLNRFHHDWRPSFLITAGLGFVWVVFWWVSYRTPPAAPKEDSTAKLGWREVVGYPQTWGFGIAKALTDPVWWFYLFWLPLYFTDVRHFTDKQLAAALPIIYIMASVGSMSGGWLSGFLMRHGWSRSKARKTAMFICAALMPVAALGVLAPTGKMAVILFSIATSAHQGFSANLFTTTSDVFPREAIGSVTGIGGCLGGAGGVLFSAIIPGYVIHRFSYTPVFLTMGAFYFIALFALDRLMGDLRPLETRVPTPVP